MFENMDEMLNNNSDLFDLTAEDLVIPEKLQFPKGELIEGTVIDCATIEKFGAVKLSVILTNTEHADKCHEMLINKPKPGKDGKPHPTAKKIWVEFLLTFWTKEQILGAQTAPLDMSQPVGKKISYRAGEARAAANGNVYQSFFGFKIQE